ncbi:MAG TPA: serine/threonine-protein kinase [Polyangiaceae bacterium]|nr:serine/threonine-protein kinase [Polyangiaceae bacterium]
MPALKGLVVADRYELLGVIAEGGQALIARAKDRQTGQLVAVKMLTSAMAQNREFVQRLAREQEAMLALAGTSAVAVLDLCQAPGGAPCLVMELLEGRDLEHELGALEARGDRLDMDRVFEIFDAIVETLERAHAAGILHRDLKPANIYLLSPDAGGGVRLLDFGLSRMKTAAPLTVLGTVLGSPSYIAPEVWGGKTDVLDQRVDVYSLAVILFRVLSGRLPFAAETLHDKFIQATSAQRPRLTTFRRDLPSQVDQWVEQALAIDPAERFATAQAAWSALLNALHFAPPARPRSAVPESIVNAWRSAAGAFRRIISGGPSPLPPKPAPLRSPSNRPATRPPTAPPPRTAPPPPPIRGPKPLDVSAEWLLDGDVLAAEDSMQFSKLIEDAPASKSAVGAGQAGTSESAQCLVRRRKRRVRAGLQAASSDSRRRRRRKVRRSRMSRR